MKRSKGAGTHRVVSLGSRFLLIGLLLLSVSGCSKRLERIESNQVKLENKIDHNAQQVSILNNNMANSQQFLEHKIEQVRRGTEVALAEALAMRYEQERLRDQTATFNKKYFAELVRIEEQNRRLHDSVSGVAGGARLINQGVRELDQGQKALQTNIDEKHAQVRDQFREVTENQADLQETADEGVAATEAVGAQVAVVKDRQDRLVRFVNNANQTMVTKVDGLAQGQQRIQRVSRRNLSRLTRQLDQTKGDLEQDHDEIKSLVSTGHDQADEEFSALKTGQESLADQSRGNRDMAVSISSDVNDVLGRADAGFSTLENGQGVLADRIRDNHDMAMAISADVNEVLSETDNGFSALMSGQGELSDQIRGNRDISMTISSDVNDVKVRQDEMYELVQQGTEDVDQDQQQIQSTLRDVRAGQQQSIQLSRRVATLETGLTEVNRSVGTLQTNLTTRMTELTGMMRALQQTRPDIAALMTELNALSSALQQIQSTQQALSARLDQVSAEAKQQNDAFMATLTELQQEETQIETVVTPSTQQPEQAQDGEDTTDSGEAVE